MNQYKVTYTTADGEEISQVVAAGSPTRALVIANLEVAVRRPVPLDTCTRVVIEQEPARHE